jgi:Uma2 family endonuclease
MDHLSARTEPTRRLNRFRAFPVKTAGTSDASPAFVIELLSASDSLSEAREKMETWLSNGAQLGWLIDPYKRNVWLYEAGKSPRLETGDSIAGTGPIEGFVLELADVWSEFADCSS